MNPANAALEKLKQQMAAVIKFNREQRLKREKEIQLRLQQLKSR
jgi:hypothetical protein